MISPSVHRHNAESGVITALAVGMVSLLPSLPLSLLPSIFPNTILIRSGQEKRSQTHPNRSLPIDGGGVILNENTPMQTQHQLELIKPGSENGEETPDVKIRVAPLN